MDCGRLVGFARLIALRAFDALHAFGGLCQFGVLPTFGCPQRVGERLVVPNQLGTVCNLSLT